MTDSTSIPPTPDDSGFPVEDAFDPGFRQALQRTHAASAAPSDLMDRVRAAMAAESLPDAGDRIVEGATPRLDVVHRPAVESVEPAGSRMSILRWLEGPRRANALAVAAVLALVVGAIGFGILVDPIDQRPPTGESVFEQAAIRAATEHGRCRCTKSLSAKVESGGCTLFPSGSLDEIAGWVTEQLSVASVVLPDLSADGYELVGASHCRLPGQLSTVHVSWRKAGHSGDGAPMISWFVAVDDDPNATRPVRDMQVRNIADYDGAPCSRVVTSVKENGLVYFLVCCDEKDRPTARERLLLTAARSDGSLPGAGP
ncbi:MAG: hypothetical protein AB8G96_15265 [Phycisphaerales bacterium]